MSELAIGDYFIHRLDLGDSIIYAYGYLHAIDDEGNSHSHYQSRTPPDKEFDIEKGEHLVMGRINERSFRLASLRNWPTDEAAVQELLDYSEGKEIPLSILEKIRLILKL